MIEKVLHINQLFATDKYAQYVCFGLGSCIGLFIVDRTRGLSGGAHIPLPSHNGGEFRDAAGMIEELLAQLSSLGSTLEGLRAKFTGGAQLFTTFVDMGALNSETVLNQLIQRKIFIAAKDVGGKISRTARFTSLTGELKISTSEQKQYII